MLDDCYLCLNEASTPEVIARCLAAICLLDASAVNVAEKYLSIAQQRLVSITVGPDRSSQSLVDSVNHIKQCILTFHKLNDSHLLVRLVHEAVGDILGDENPTHEKSIKLYLEKLRPDIASWYSFFADCVVIIQTNLQEQLATLSTPHEIQALQKTLHAVCCDKSIPRGYLAQDKEDALWLVIFQVPFTSQVSTYYSLYI